MRVPTLLQRGGLRRILVLLAGLVVVWRWWPPRFACTKHLFAIGHARLGQVSKALVVASMEKDDTSWIQTHLSDWIVYRYVVDTPSAQYTVPQNKGREAMVYLR
jgi:Protein of unknown function (DUF3431)